ncbi:hypothetical protein GCM10010377_56830 [Streptomyces viridiviolaceus]|uniref:HNH endonuclease n=1 Tax=Streptomyces viridiviolaceus TaxID=68282 RepID=A0ABW2DXQ4_9ACTN|nr:hypothetical protein [Streptomyces viridiviolaceus]GHB58502.1 hypothetical protein GCM10010377_56830 [Streptomyces viridiviolaceus]
MWKRRRRKERQADTSVRVELCDLCAAVFPEDRAVRGYVQDSSAAHPEHDGDDGLRLVTACGNDHFDTIAQGYRHRPFVQEELWAAKVSRALTTGPTALTMQQLAWETGLHEPQIRRGIAWHNQRMRQSQDMDP